MRALVWVVTLVAGCGSSGSGEAESPGNTPGGAATAGAAARAPSTGAVAAQAPQRPRKRTRSAPMFVTEHDVTLRVQMEADARRRSFASQTELDAKGAPVLARRDDGCYTIGAGAAPPVDVACPATYDDAAWDNCPDGTLYAVDASECYCEAAAAPKAGGARPIWRNACPKKLRGK